MFQKSYIISYDYFIVFIFKFLELINSQTSLTPLQYKDFINN